MSFQFLENISNIKDQDLEHVYESAFYLSFVSIIYFVFFGGFLGISQIIGSILKQQFSQSSRTKLTIVSGLIFFSALIKTLQHEHLTNFQRFDTIEYSQKTSGLRLIIAGLFVGFGSQFAIKDQKNNFSLDSFPSLTIKSILSHILILLAACLTHTFGIYKYLPPTPKIIDFNLPNNVSYTTYLLIFVLIPFICFVISKAKSFKSLISYISLFLIGIGFGYALMYGGYTQRKNVYTFFSLNKKWNPQMILIYGIILIIQTIVYFLMKYFIKKPLFGVQMDKQNSSIKLNLIIGCIIFGIGWGLGGLTPITILLLMPVQSLKITIYWGISCIIGMKISHKIFQIVKSQPLKNQ